MWPFLLELWKRLKGLIGGAPQVQVSIPTLPQGGKIKVEVELEQPKERARKA